MKEKTPYWQLLQDPRWQRKRLELLQGADFKCEVCGDTTTTLHVHHQYYVSSKLPWEYPDFCYEVLCKECHSFHDVHIEQNRNDGEESYKVWELLLTKLGKNWSRILWNSSFQEFKIYNRENAVREMTLKKFWDMVETNNLISLTKPTEVEINTVQPGGDKI